MPTTCQIEIEFENNPSQVVYSGQLLRGTVHLTTTREKIIRKAYIKIVGKANVQWSEDKQDRQRDYAQNREVVENTRTLFVGKEKYLHQVMHLITGGNDGLRLSPGNHVFAFATVLPKDLPTSFEGRYGHIRYRACVILDFKNQREKQFKMPFTVITACNLNDEPLLRQPNVAKKEQTFTPCFVFCCCTSDPLEITVHTAVRGYVPGQNIGLDVIVKNHSNQHISQFKVELIKQITYHAGENGTYKKCVTNVIAKGKTPGIDAYQDDAFRVNIPVPSVPPTDTGLHRLIKIRYYFQILGVVGGCHRNPFIRMPITILSRPIDTRPITTAPVITSPPRISVLSSNELPMFHEEENQIPSPRPSAPMEFPNNELPTYEEAMQYEITNAGGFIPKYPVFRQQTSYANHIANHI